MRMDVFVSTSWQAIINQPRDEAGVHACDQYQILGWFLSSVSVTTSSTKEFIVHLGNCSLRDAGTKSLMQSICSSIDPHRTVNTNLDMWLWSN